MSRPKDGPVRKGEGASTLTATASGAPGESKDVIARADDRLTHLPKRVGQVFVCAAGCCCGHMDRGFAPVPVQLYEREWVRRKLATIQLTASGCLGACSAANVVMLLFYGRAVWFHSFNTEAQVVALFDYIEQMVSAQSYLPPPAPLAEYHFTAFTWEPPSGEEADVSGAAASGQGSAAHG